MDTCKNCNGFVPRELSRCPHCENISSVVVKKAKLSAKILGVSAVSLTLMACYGAPPDDLPDYVNRANNEHSRANDAVNNTDEPNETNDN